MRCPNYKDNFCMYGKCPKDYPKYGYKPCSCDECEYYKGCEDCYYNDKPNYCSELNKKNYKSIQLLRSDPKLKQRASV